MTARNVDGLAARLAALSKRSTKELRAAYEKQHRRSPRGFSRNALIKTLATAPTTTPPAKTPPPKQAKPTTTTAPERRTGARDPRLPAPGTVLERVFKGKTHKVTVKEDGFEYAGKPYRSLTAVAKEATGYPSISGTAWFGIAKPATRKATKG